jgi:hypothetical protein
VALQRPRRARVRDTLWRGEPLGARRPQPKMTTTRRSPCAQRSPGMRSWKPPLLPRPQPLPPPPPALNVSPRTLERKGSRGTGPAQQPPPPTKRRRPGRPQRPRRLPAARPCPSSQRGSWPGLARPGPWPRPRAGHHGAARLLPPLLSLPFARSRPLPLALSPSASLPPPARPPARPPTG